MVSITLSVSEDLKKRMERHPEVTWSEVVRSVIRQQLDELDEAERIAGASRLSAKDIAELAAAIDEGVSLRWKAVSHEARR